MTAFSNWPKPKRKKRKPIGKRKTQWLRSTGVDNSLDKLFGKERRPRFND